MNKKILTAVLLLVQLHGVAQTFSASDFTDTVPPVVYSGEWTRLNNNVANTFSVAVLSGQLVISKYVYNNGVTEFAVPGGSLLGIDHGEFGGGLYYAPADSTKKTFFINGQRGPMSPDIFRGGLSIPRTNPLNALIKDKFLIARGNVKAIFPYKNSLYFIEGLAHMGLSFGSLYKLDIKKDSFTVSKMIDFEDAPMALAIHNDTIYIATYDQFYIANGLTKELVFKNLFWNSLYPESIAVADNEHIYVGMRGGYAAINLPARQLKFYKYTR